MPVTVKACAFLTMEDTAGWSIDADLAIAPLEARGWRVTSVPWRSRAIDWNLFAAVYIGTPWDYPDDVPRFLDVLEEIDRSDAVLVNCLSLVRWNIAKTYLRDLGARGAPVVPSLWLDRLEPGQLAGLFERFGSAKLILKPVISTNATDTFLLDRDAPGDAEREMLRVFTDRPLVVQPFLASVREEGEYSLFFFGPDCSHAIRKVPKAGDFRVQEEHGAAIVPATPDRALANAARRVMRLVDPAPVYARCDFVRGSDGRYLLMELELIEPSMYLRMHEGAAEAFADAFDRHVTASSSCIRHRRG